jgi:bifunctional DNA-binding transcriptional regulator/antitoxin component of YhaV-PrlF toxin-antitoxin module
VCKDGPMTVLKIEDPTHIQLPEDVGERLGLKQGEVVIITIEADRVILESVSAALSTRALVSGPVSRQAR